MLAAVNQLQGCYSLIDDIWKVQLLSQAQIKGMRRHKEEISFECQAQLEALTTLNQRINTEHKNYYRMTLVT